MAWYLQALLDGANWTALANKMRKFHIRFHAGSLVQGKKMATIIDTPFVYAHYPYDFRKDRDVKEPWEGDE